MKYLNLVSLTLAWNTFKLFLNMITRVEYIHNINSLLETRYDNIGTKEIDKKDQYIIISNHKSIYDIPIMLELLYSKELYNISGIGKKKHIYSKVLKKLVATETGVPFPWAGDKNIISSSLSIIKAGFSFLIFPEGQRNKTDENLQRFRKGVDTIVKGSELDILMFYIYKSNTIIKCGNRNIYVKYCIVPAEDLKNSTVEDIYKKTFQI